LRKLVELQAATGKPNLPLEPVAFSRRQVREFTGLPNTTLHRYLTELLEFEYLLRDKSAHTQQHRYRLDWDGAPSSVVSPPLAGDRSTPSASIPSATSVRNRHGPLL
jgi:hypothetical protein